MSIPTHLDVFRCPLDGINLIEASAGTGKTWNICGLYLRLLLERELEVQRILVVTFTNAATAELRERIRGRIVETLDYLDSGRTPSGDPFVATLIGELVECQGRQADGLVKRLNLALETFDEASIFTIHGFCQRALADNPFAAGLPMSMELTPDDKDWRLQAVHDFWRRHLAGDALAPIMAAYLHSTGDTPETCAALLQRHLAKPLAINLWPQHSERAIDVSELETAYAQAGAIWREQGGEIRQRLLDSLTQINRQTYREDSIQAGAQAWDDLFRADSPLAACRTLVVDSENRPRRDRFLPDSPPHGCFMGQEAGKKGAGAVDLQPTIPKSDRLLASLGDKADLYRASRLAERTNKNCVTPCHLFFDQAEAYLNAREIIESELVRERLHLIRTMLHEAGEGLRELKRAQRVVSFDDMLFNLHERLSNGTCPWLAPSLKARFPAALIDEFQDTDPLQLAIFQSIYGAGDAPLFLVGDPKQAIYSFRHADLHTYLRARQLAGAEHSLVANQRSSAGLIHALNTLFAANPAAFMLPGLVYQRVEYGNKPRKPFVDHSGFQGGQQGDLQIWMLHEPTGDAPAKKIARRNVVAATAAEIARLINAAQAGRISLDGRPLRPGDIAVLVRSHAQGGEIKRALAQLRVGSVELSQASVFDSVDAEEVERVLRAILEPGREGLLRAALATELLGCDAGEIEAVMRDEAKLMLRLGQFNTLRETWHKRGFGVMYRRLLGSERVAWRMLARPDGERRLTNFLHLGECLHQAAETHAAPEALLRYLEGQRRERSSDEDAQLRLESDQDLVQIVTIHKSKGLEYPIVFCPFLWDGRAGFGGGETEGFEYHDADGLPVIDWRGDEIPAAELKAIKAKIKLEQAAEFLRLIYVALTRAIYRSYLVAGCYSSTAFGRMSITESSRGMLNWLVAGGGYTPETWFEAKPAAADITAAWSALADGDRISLSPLPMHAAIPVEVSRNGPDNLVALAPPASIPNGWRISSYSGLSHGALGGERLENEPAASDHDARIIATPGQAPAALPASLPADDILLFPRGATAGDCIHTVFEKLDFTDPSTWSNAILSGLAGLPQSLSGGPEKARTERLARMLANMIRDVTETDLGGAMRLNSVSLNRRLTELEFSLPARALAAGALNEALKNLGYRGPRLTFNALQGYLKGFIDLVFEHQGRYFILDWKSNHLGYDVAAYLADPAEGPVADAMAEHGYHLQYLLYTVALDRFLRRRIPGYQYETHFGGVLYLFVRGVRPTWCGPDGAASGVYRHRPDAAAIARLNALLDAT